LKVLVFIGLESLSLILDLDLDLGLGLEGSSLGLKPLSLILDLDLDLDLGLGLGLGLGLDQPPPSKIQRQSLFSCDDKRRSKARSTQGGSVTVSAMITVTSTFVIFCDVFLCITAMTSSIH